MKNSIGYGDFVLAALFMLRAWRKRETNEVKEKIDEETSADTEPLLDGTGSERNEVCEKRKKKKKSIDTHMIRMRNYS